MGSQIQKQRTTIYMICEGKCDFVFMQYLKQVYAPRNSGIEIKLKKGKGGGVVKLVHAAIRTPASYDTRVVKLDHDREKNEIKEAILLAKKKGVLMFFSIPCLEAMLLQIVENSDKYRAMTTSACKDEFETKYISGPKRENHVEYEILFSREVLDEAASRMPELKQIIDLFTTHKY